MQTNPKVSVVIPTYGRAKMVKQAVLSAFTQELEPHEVIVSDDCSPDDTIKVLKEIVSYESRLKIIENKINSGGVSNWNKVIDSSSGDIICWCSDDDYFMPYHLKQSVQFLIDHPEVDMVHSRFLHLIQPVKGFPIILPTVRSCKVKIFFKNELLRHMISNTCYPFHPSTWVFRRKIWESVGKFNEKYEVADYDWFIRVGFKHKIAYLPHCSVVNRRHEKNWSNRVGSIKMNLEFYEMIENAFSMLDQSSLSIKIMKTNWYLKTLLLFFRIYVARSRAGYKTVALEASTIIWNILFKKRPKVFFKIYNIIMKKISFILMVLQRIFFCGKNKYAEMGKTELV